MANYCLAFSFQKTVIDRKGYRVCRQFRVLRIDLQDMSDVNNRIKMEMEAMSRTPSGEPPTITSTFICKDIPYGKPTECLLRLTLSPDGYTPDMVEIRQESLHTTIGAKNTMSDAFGDFAKKWNERHHAPIGWSWTPIDFSLL